MTGWWHYYPVALAVKVPLAVGLLLVARLAFGPRQALRGANLLLTALPLLFLALAMVASKRNYGVRYLLPMAPVAIVWLAALATGPRAVRALAWLGASGLALATFAAHPHHLSYFNHLAGGTWGGRFVLSDSNLDWGQGPLWLADLQHREPKYRDLTLYQFGQADPSDYGVVSRSHLIDAGDTHPGLPASLRADSRFVAVSASLQWGPWGPAGYFKALDRLQREAMTADGTIAIYRTRDVAAKMAPLPLSHRGAPRMEDRGAWRPTCR